MRQLVKKNQTVCRLLLLYASIMTEDNVYYDPRFRVPGNMQIVGPSLSGKTTWLYRLVKDAPSYFRLADGEPCHFHNMLYCYGSS